MRGAIFYHTKCRKSRAKERIYQYIPNFFTNVKYQGCRGRSGKGEGINFPTPIPNNLRPIGKELYKLVKIYNSVRQSLVGFSWKNVLQKFPIYGKICA